MAKIVTVDEMRAIEKAADGAGLSYGEMMENAGKSIAGEILARFPDIEGKRVGILVGSGNNGGDGLVVGHYLHEAGASVGVYLVKPRGSNDENFARIKRADVLVAEAGEDQRGRVLKNLIGSADIVVDAVLGTGFELPLDGVAKDVLSIAKSSLAKRESPPFVVAVDCPSGLDCDTGAIADEALMADLTVTLGAAKPGLVTFPGANHVGVLRVGDIGEKGIKKALEKIHLELATVESVAGLLPERPKDAHKGTFGRAVIVAGSVNYPGAAALAALAAYRTGAGLVTLAAPGSLQSLIAPQIPDATWFLLPHETGVIAAGAAALLKKDIGETEAFLIGPGLGREETTREFLWTILGGEGEAGSKGRIGFVPERQGAGGGTFSLSPCVIDADGLNLLTEIDNWPRLLPEDTILTPHPGEMARLTGEAKESLEGDRIDAARRWAKKWDNVVILKGAFTVVAAPNGRATVLPFATAALAKAGSGDVLAGAVVGLKAQGLGSYEAAVLGGYLHGRAGEIAAEYAGNEASVMASDVVDSIPEAIAEVALRRGRL